MALTLVLISLVKFALRVELKLLEVINNLTTWNLNDLVAPCNPITPPYSQTAGLLLFTEFLNFRVRSTAFGFQANLDFQTLSALLLWAQPAGGLPMMHWEFLLHSYLFTPCCMLSCFSGDVYVCPSLSLRLSSCLKNKDVLSPLCCQVLHTRDQLIVGVFSSTP